MKVFKNSQSEFLDKCIPNPRMTKCWGGEEIETKLQRLIGYPHVLGSSNSMARNEWCMTKPEGGNPIWRLQTGSTNISTCRQDRNEMSTAILMFLGSSYLVGLVVMLIDQTRSGKFKMMASKLHIIIISTSRQGINTIPTAPTYVFEIELSNGRCGNTARPYWN